MNLNQKEIIEIEKLSKSHAVVKKLWEEWEAINRDGIKTFYICLNEKLIQLSEQIDNADLDIEKSTDKTYDRIFTAMIKGGTIAENLKMLKKELKGEDFEEMTSSRIDRLADKKRKNI